MNQQKISINTRLSIQWRVCNELKQAEQSDFINVPAIQLLEILDNQSNYHSLFNINSQTKQSDINRLESKLDLLLLMFSQSEFNQKYSHIPNFEVCLSSQSMKIKTAEKFQMNQLIEMDVFFSRHCSESLLLSGIVSNIDSYNTVSVDFENIGNLTQNYLEKYVFRLHRIDIARSKSELS